MTLNKFKLGDEFGMGEFLESVDHQEAENERKVRKEAEREKESAKTEEDVQDVTEAGYY